MGPFIIFLGCLVWISLIIKGFSQKDEEEKAVVTQPEKPVKEDLPKVFLESISDEQLQNMFGNVHKKDDKYVSISSLNFHLSDSLSSKIYVALYPRFHTNIDNYWSTMYDNPSRKRITDAYVTLYLAYFDKDFVFCAEKIHLKKQTIGYVCEHPDHNKLLKDLKEFHKDSSLLSESDFKYFKAKADELLRQEKDLRVKGIVEKVFEAHLHYNKEAISYNTEKAVPINSIATFYNFCELIGKSIPTPLKAEVTNYLYILFGSNDEK